MSRRETFDDALDAAINAVQHGDSIDAVLARFPRHAPALRPLLETASAANPSRAYLSPTSRLTENFARVESALGRARWERDNVHPGRATASAPWWTRRVAFASLSLPAGIFAFALLGAGGAAAATLAVTTDLPEQIGERVESLTPSWTHGVIPGGAGDSAGPIASATPAGAAADTATPASSPTAGAGGDETPVPSETPRGSQPLTVSGTITNVRGNTFELTTGGMTYKVQTDTNTSVSGQIVEGAPATVQGELTATDRLHATSVVAWAPPALDPEHTPPLCPPYNPGQGGPPETPPGQGGPPATPPGQGDPPATPPGQGQKTKTPGPPATPPGQGSGGGGSSENENGNGGGNNGNGGGNGNN